MGRVQLDCPFCDDVIEAATVNSMKDNGSAHLEDLHDSRLTSVFAETHGDEPCHDCGHVFSVDDDGGEFDCPECGYDNFQPLVQRYLYWQIETE